MINHDIPQLTNRLRGFAIIFKHPLQLPLAPPERAVAWSSCSASSVAFSKLHHITSMIICWRLLEYVICTEHEHARLLSQAMDSMDYKITFATSMIIYVECGACCDHWTLPSCQWMSAKVNETILWHPLMIDESSQIACRLSLQSYWKQWRIGIIFTLHPQCWYVGLASILGKLLYAYHMSICVVGSLLKRSLCLRSLVWDPQPLWSLRTVSARYLLGICERSSHSEGLTQPSAQALKDLQERLVLPCHVALRKDGRMDNNILRQNPSMKIEKLKA